MGSDYPDWTDIIQIVGSDIMVPIDVQGAYIMMPVDIQAQYMTLNIDITAQTIGNLTIDVEAQSVAMFIGAEWNIKEGNGKTLNVSGVNYGFGDSGYISYTIPTGKTYYITYLSFGNRASAAENADLNQMGGAYLWDQTDSKYLALIGGNGGGGVSFPAPLELATGKELRLYVVNRANHDCDPNACCGGYVI